MLKVGQERHGDFVIAAVLVLLTLCYVPFFCDDLLHVTIKALGISSAKRDMYCVYQPATTNATNAANGTLGYKGVWGNPRHA